MNIRLQTIREGFDGVTCWAQSRIGSTGEGLVLTTQKLTLAGSDVYGLIHSMHSQDGGASWSPLTPQNGFLLPGRTVSDTVPALHKKTGRLLTTGGSVVYSAENPLEIVREAPRRMFYSVYDTAAHAWGPARRPVTPDGREMEGFTAGCCRRVDMENGDILLPVSRRPAVTDKITHAVVLRLRFDGETLVCMEEGNELHADHEARGCAEPSMVYFKGRYYLTIRTDSKGYAAVSDDGLHFGEPRPWVWDTGILVPTYNTQQNWVRSPDALYLVYTRRDGKNDHVFRNRAPLYMAQVDTETLSLLRHTEVALTPERGARMGNFGVTELSETQSIVVTTEWMQPVGCEKYGSNNAIFAAYVTF